MKYVSSIFCDDIRFELGNKITLVGIYSGDMFVESFPFYLPKMGVQIRYDAPIEHRMGNLKFCISNGDERLAEYDVPPVESQSILQEGHDVITRQQRVFNCLLPSMVVTRPGTIRTSVFDDGVETPGGKLRISAMPRPEAS